MLYHANQLDAIAATRPVGVTGLLLALGASLGLGGRRLRRPVAGTDARNAPRPALGAARRARRDRDRLRRSRPAAHSAAVLLAIPAAISGTLGLYASTAAWRSGRWRVVAPIAGASAIVPVVFGIAPATGRRRCSTRGSPRARRRRARLAGAPGGRQAQASPPASGLRSSQRSASGSTSRRCTRRKGRSRLGLPDLPDHLHRDRPPRGRVRRPAIRLAGWKLPIVLGVGLGDTLGNVLFASADHHGALVSVTSVLASLYPIVDGPPRRGRPARAPRAGAAGRRRAHRGRRADRRLALRR